MSANTPSKNSGEDRGFTLIELIVVMVIIGVLAAVALPVYQNQQRQAVDTGTKSDLRAIAAELNAYYMEPKFANRQPSLWVYDYNGKRQAQLLTIIRRNGWWTQSFTPMSPGTRRGTYKIVDRFDYCISLTNANGKLKTFKIEPSKGVSEGFC